MKRRTLKFGSSGTDVVTLQNYLHLVADGIFGPVTLEAVLDFQKNKGLKADGVVGDRTWEALQYNRSPLREIDKIILHCTATPEGKDFTVEQIKNIHVRLNGWSDIGYHYVVYRDGSVHRGRPERKIGAHTSGYNAHSIGIAYVGGLATDGKTPKDTRTDAQRKALANLVRSMKNKYPRATVHGHNEFANKACPCFNVSKEF